MTYEDSIQREKNISRALAVAIHVGFLLLLVFGVSWQKRHSEPGAVVDLWSTMAPPKQEAPAPPPRPEPKVEPKPAPRAAPKPEPKPVIKPDILLREKLEKERKLKEKQELEKRQELEKKKEDEAKKLKAQQQLEARKKEEEKKKLENERLAQELEAKRLAQEKQDLAKRLASEQANSQSKLVGEYKRRIHDRIRSLIIEPPGLQGNPMAEFDVVLIPGGEVLTVRLRRSSGVPAYDAAVERAILKASPLPLPPDPALFAEFRELHLPVRPKP